MMIPSDPVDGAILSTRGYGCYQKTNVDHVFLGTNVDQDDRCAVTRIRRVLVPAGVKVSE